MHWVNFVSRRFIRRDHTKIMLIVAVAISVAALIAVLAIMNGLQLVTISNLIQIESYHLTIRDDMRADERERIRSAIRADTRFSSVVAFTDLQTIVYSEKSDFQGVTIRAVDVQDALHDQKFIEQLNVLYGDFDLSENNVIIGLSLARLLRVAIGDTFQVFGHNGQVTPVRVRGIFQSGYPPFDTGWMVMSIAHAYQAVNNALPVYIGVKYHDEQDERLLLPVVEERVSEILGRAPTLVTWQMSNRAIFSALKLEKIFIIFSLGMIFVIVAINVYQSLARKVRQYEQELVILKAMGGEGFEVQRVITYMGVYIGLIGGVAGVVTGLWLSLNIANIFRIVELLLQMVIRFLNSIIILLPNISISPLPYISGIFFFVNIAPHRLFIGECVAIFLFAVTISSIAAYIASRRTTTIRPIMAFQRMMY